MENIRDLFDISIPVFRVFGYPMSLVELTGTSFGLISVWLATKANIHTWTTGLINIVLFFIIYYQVQLYSDMFLQVFFFGATFLGLWQWMHKKPEQDDKKITMLSSGERILYGLVMALGTVFLGKLISGIHIYLPGLFPRAATYPFADAFTTVLSITATFFMAYKKVECWILWILVDVVSIYLYFQKEILFISMEYIVFLILASYGLVEWKKAYRHA